MGALAQNVWIISAAMTTSQSKKKKSEILIKKLNHSIIWMTSEFYFVQVVNATAIVMLVCTTLKKIMVFVQTANIIHGVTNVILAGQGIIEMQPSW